jgi:hypothetical protein
VSWRTRFPAVPVQWDACTVPRIRAGPAAVLPRNRPRMLRARSPTGYWPATRSHRKRSICGSTPGTDAPRRQRAPSAIYGVYRRLLRQPLSSAAGERGRQVDRPRIRSDRLNDTARHPSDQAQGLYRADVTGYGRAAGAKDRGQAGRGRTHCMSAACGASAPAALPTGSSLRYSLSTTA